jgi:TonB family protein
MAEQSSTRPDAVNASAGHLSVHLDDAVRDVPFLFERQTGRVGGALVASAFYHAAFFLAIVLAVRYGAPQAITGALLPDEPNSGIIWLESPGPGGGGGGGGNKMKEPPKVAELPGKDKITVPVAKPPSLEMPKETKVEQPMLAPINIPAETTMASNTTSLGAIEAAPSVATLSQGSGSGGGFGTGRGTGSGSGTGSGLGAGSGGGTGGGVYQPGNGVTAPRLISDVKPQYTPDAMRARVQGVVLLKAVVRPDGSVSDIEVIRSLDSAFGLDLEAIKAARQWRFAPGRLRGEPVAVAVTIELTFTLR